jgi:methylmalonyl-CoA mutase
MNDHQEWMRRAQASAHVLPKDILFPRIEGPRAFKEDHAPWDVFGVLVSASSETAQEQLAGGATGLILQNADTVKALSGLPLHSFAIRNEAGDDAALQLIDMIASQPLDPARLRIAFGLRSSTHVKRLIELGYAGPYFDCVEADDGLVGILLSAAAYLRSSSGTHTGQWCGVKLIADHHMFHCMAKFRAMRILWSRVLQECGRPNSPLHLHAEIKHDPTQHMDNEAYMISATAACFGAGLGGASSIAIYPFKQETFERRMAINVQNVLLHESQLWRVADPAAGAGYVESLTQNICDETWQLFQQAERAQ